MGLDGSGKGPLESAIELVGAGAFVRGAEGGGECSSDGAFIDGVGERAFGRMGGADMVVMVDGALS